MTITEATRLNTLLRYLLRPDAHDSDVARDAAAYLAERAYAATHTSLCGSDVVAGWSTGIGASLARRMVGWTQGDPAPTWPCHIYPHGDDAGALLATAWTCHVYCLDIDPDTPLDTLVLPFIPPLYLVVTLPAQGHRSARIMEVIWCPGATPEIPSSFMLLVAFEADDPVGPEPGARTCRSCGCTDACACPGGCHWVSADLCSACAPVLLVPPPGGTPGLPGPGLPAPGLPGAATLDSLMDVLADLRQEHPGDTPVGYYCCGDGDYASLAGRVTAELIGPCEDVLDFGGSIYRRRAPGDDPRAHTAIVLWPVGDPAAPAPIATGDAS